MPNTCTICKHQKRNEIDLLLVQGKSLRLIGNQFAVDYKAVERHRSFDISPSVFDRSQCALRQEIRIKDASRFLLDR